MKRTIPDGEGRQIVVGLSGGVDSAVSAWLLKEAGWQVTGLFMKNWEDDDDSEYCSSRQDWLDAASVADVIGIDLEAVNFAADYRERVFRLFLEAYEAGFTPNPDVLCNAEIKFKAFLDHALKLGAERIATGHYAGSRVGPDGRVQLLRGADRNKDQSYFLHRLNQYQLSSVVFPLAGYTKPEVREIAARIGLPNATKKDSTGICFIGERPFREFLSRYLPTQPGPIVDDRGVQVGEHVGLSFYTLGQRKGIGIGGRRDNAGGEPWFVAGKDLATNTLTVVRGHDHSLLLTRELVGRDVHWIGDAPITGKHYGIKARYRQEDADGWLEGDVPRGCAADGFRPGAARGRGMGAGIGMGQGSVVGQDDASAIAREVAASLGVPVPTGAAGQNTGAVRGPSWGDVPVRGAGGMTGPGWPAGGMPAAGMSPGRAAGVPDRGTEAGWPGVAHAEAGGVGTQDPVTGGAWPGTSHGTAGGASRPGDPAASGGPRIEVHFSSPQWAVTPGQSAVFYDGEVCLGGCIIDRKPARA